MIQLIAIFSLLFGIWGTLLTEAKAQSEQKAVDAPEFAVDPFWPKPLPDRWVTGELGGVCVDAQDHVFALNRAKLTAKEQRAGTAAPPVIEFDPEGNAVNSWGDRDLLPQGLHGCFVDYQGNVWIGGAEDGIVQKYTHDGSKMLLQIGTKGTFDSSDGTVTGAPMNSSHVYLNLPTSIAVDSTNGDVYIADGYANRRVAVFDRDGHYLRQWGRQGTLAEVKAGVGGVFLKGPHCVVIGKDSLVYVCDQEGHRIEVFDKMGGFRRNYPLVESKFAPVKGGGRACWTGFSVDPAQKFIYVADCGNDVVQVLDREAGQAVSSFGRAGLQAGEFESPHTMAVDSKGNIYVAESVDGRRLQIFRPAK